ncbi:MAG: PEP/pyruvate-binding domain-containing protein [Acidobacteriota bacterium]
MQRFHDLMPYRVHNMLLVSSLYDSFILAEDGQISELVLSEFLDLNLHHIPGLSRVSTGAEALSQIQGERQFNLIVTSLHLGDMNAAELARRVRESGHDIPVVVLAFSSRELKEFTARADLRHVERIFLWQGDVRILLAIVKYIEDKRNVAHDTQIVGTQSIIVVEDNVRFYSSYLPLIYTELVKQSQSVLLEGVNLSQKLLRMRARPKILLCDTYEDAWDYYTRYKDDLLGIVSDIQFPREGEVAPLAGVDLARRVRQEKPDLPILLQSSMPQNRELARSIGVDFLLKGSPVLLNDLRRFMTERFSFGDFVFVLPDGTEVGRAADLREMERMLRTVPEESIAFHGEKNDFSNWMKARTEFELANEVRPRKVSDFETLEHLRQDLVSSIRRYRKERDRGLVADFDRTRFDGNIELCRIGGGSLGGKARGLAFANFLLNTYAMEDRFPGVRVAVPSAVVLGTDVFDRFLEENDLRDFALEVRDDAEMRRRFQKASFPEDARMDLAAYLSHARHPLAVRSSSLLEDSAHQPFAGIYETFMLPNNQPDAGVRLEKVIQAVKDVYASTFTTHAKAYLDATPYRLEEEKMAVIIQRMVGAPHGKRFYPAFSGVARSYNFYPTGPMAAEDGIAAIALGLGRTVVEGETCLRFCPRYPKHVVQFSSVQDVLNNSQRAFYALRLDAPLESPEHSEVTRFDLEAAEEDHTLGAVGSTYSQENDAIYDGISRSGIRLVSFAPILKHRLFPLAEILTFLMDLGTWGTSSDVELEFAVNLAVPEEAPQEFGFLQMRPQAVSDPVDGTELEEVEPERVLCRSDSVLGHGKLQVRDVVVADYDRFDRARSREAAQEVGRFNAALRDENTPYLLIGVGRWGSNDPWLGIPVSWDEIAGASVIVESGFRDFQVSPSQGTHFFHNLTAQNIGYFTVNPESGSGSIDWKWLGSQPELRRGQFFRHLRFDQPLTILMDGRRQEGMILKPAPDAPSPG